MVFSRSQCLPGRYTSQQEQDREKASRWPSDPSKSTIKSANGHTMHKKDIFSVSVISWNKYKHTIGEMRRTLFTTTKIYTTNQITLFYHSVCCIFLVILSFEKSKFQSNSKYCSLEPQFLFHLKWQRQDYPKEDDEEQTYKKKCKKACHLFGLIFLFGYCCLLYLITMNELYLYRKNTDSSPLIPMFWNAQRMTQWRPKMEKTFF